MACKCFTTMADMAKEKLTTRLGDQLGKLAECGFEHSLWHFNGGDHSPVALNYQFRYYRKRKNGENEVRQTKYDHFIYMNYCPLCGTQFEGDKPKTEGNADAE